MLGYIFNTEEEAKTARKQCADFYGLPKTENDVTKYWVDFQYSILDNFWFIKFDDSIREILGDPQEITITINE
ncbi:hypothetical protein [Flavobacterium sp.]|uniref:hypothetical protein n=1 Tax=Flavobacterium sp. TaxID=239 RepID=UPI004047AC52